MICRPSPLALYVDSFIEFVINIYPVGWTCGLKSNNRIESYKRIALSVIITRLMMGRTMAFITINLRTLQGMRRGISVIMIDWVLMMI